MPNSMIHLLIAKKVKPDARIGFFVGNLAPDAIHDDKIKDKAHLYDVPDREAILKQFALKANNDYLKGIVLHLFTDTKFHAFWNENTLFPYRESIEWLVKNRDEQSKINSFAYHNTEWAYNLFEEMENWDYIGYIKTEYINQEDVKWFIPWKHEWCIKNNLTSSSVFPPALVEKFVNDTVEDFNKWFLDLNS